MGESARNPFVAEHRVVKQLDVQNNGHLYECRWSSDGSWLALGGPAVGGMAVWSFHRASDGRPHIERTSQVPFSHHWAFGWRPATSLLAGVARDRLLLLDVTTGATASLDRPIYSGGTRLSWSPDGQSLVVQEADQGFVYSLPVEPAQGTARLTEVMRFEDVDGRNVSWSPTSKEFAFVSEKAIDVASVSNRSSRLRIGLPDRSFCAPAWAPDGRILAIGVRDNIHIVDAATGKLIAELKAHTSLIMTLAFSPDQRLLASTGWDDKIRLWVVDDWRLAASIEYTAGSLQTNWLGLSFHPTLPLLCATATAPGGGVSLYELDVDGMLSAPVKSVNRYATAKVVLVGESGVGKTGLAYRLATGEYKEHSSTHGQQFWVLDSLHDARSDGVRCDVVLWDLAGQPDYRLIHVLFLDDADVALVVLDASRRHELLDVVTFWVKALDASGRGGCVKILVSARTDRGNAAISAEELREFSDRLGIEAGFVETSARTGDGLPELTQALREHLSWDDLSVVIETPSLTAVRDEVLRLKEQQSGDQPIVSIDALRGRLVGEVSEAEVEAAVRDLQLHGFVHVLRAADGGGLVLLRPDMLNNLAASLVLEARRNERGLGALDEAGVRDGRYRLPELDGLHENQQRVLIESAVVLFLEHNVCFREPLGDQVLLIFPELINEKPPTLADATQFADDVTYLVTGSIQNVYASLVVLLGYTNVLRRRDQWRDQARYELDGQPLHFRQERRRDDRLEIVLSYPDGVAPSARRVFQGLVEQFLRRSRVDVKMYPRVDCPECGMTLQREQVIRSVDKGAGRTFCPDDGRAIPLAREPEQVSRSAQEQQVLNVETTAAAERTMFTVVAAQLRGYLAGVAHREHPVNVFVSYPWGDSSTEEWVRDRLVPDLEQAGIEVILDLATSRIGDNIARFVERVPAVDRVLVVATPAYLQKYQAGTVVGAEADLINLRLLGTEEQKATVLPVLLAGEPAESLPSLMRTRIHADFRDPAGYFPQLFDLVLALHDLPPETPALKDLRLALRRRR